MRRYCTRTVEYSEVTRTAQYNTYSTPDILRWYQVASSVLVLVPGTALSCGSDWIYRGSVQGECERDFLRRRVLLWHTLYSYEYCTSVLVCQGTSACTTQGNQDYEYLLPGQAECGEIGHTWVRFVRTWYLRTRTRLPVPGYQVQ